MKLKILTEKLFYQTFRKIILISLGEANLWDQRKNYFIIKAKEKNYFINKAELYQTDSLKI